MTITPFVIVGAERTGSNLLQGLLQSHPKVCMGGELFNEIVIQSRSMPWPHVDELGAEQLLTLRDRSPLPFVDRLFADAADRGYEAVGFKLLYYHGEQYPGVRDHLAHTLGAKVIHITRRNLFRRFVSQERAKITGEWARTEDSAAAPPPPPLNLSLDETVKNFLYIRRQQAEADDVFGSCDTLHVVYEDLARDPQAVGSAAISFLGMERHGKLDVAFRKMATDSMRDAVANYDELEAEFASWAAMFDA